MAGRSRYHVMVLANADTVVDEEFSSLAVATSVFQREAARIVHDKSASVTLSFETVERIDITLAKKELNTTFVVFGTKYYELASECRRRRERARPTIADHPREREF